MKDSTPLMLMGVVCDRCKKEIMDFVPMYWSDRYIEKFFGMYYGVKFNKDVLCRDCYNKQENRHEATGNI